MMTKQKHLNSAEVFDFYRQNILAGRHSSNDGILITTYRNRIDCTGYQHHKIKQHSTHKTLTPTKVTQDD
jgi:hypothetical protein